MQLTLLYTANLRGNMPLLPRLYTYLRRLQQQASGHTLLLDTGNACDASSWHCQLTGGRSALLVMDAMGYQAVNVSGFLTAAGRAKLAENRMGMAPLAAGDVWEQDGVLITIEDQAVPQPHQLHVVLSSAAQTVMTHHQLQLAEIEGGQVGIVQIDSAGDNGRLTITSAEVRTMPASTLPDPTITATVDFVLSEARYYGRDEDSKPD